jgi:hypothetical protein
MSHTPKLLPALGLVANSSPTLRHDPELTSVSIFMRLLRSFAALARALPDDPRLLAFLGSLPHLSSQAGTGSARRVLVQCVGDPYFLGLFSSGLAALAQRQSIRCDLFVLRSIDAAVGVGPKTWVRRSFLHSGWFAQQWVRVYKHLMNVRVGYRSVSWSHPWGDLRALVQAWAVWRRRPDGIALEELRAHGVLIGDLVIDTYLRFRPAATIDVSDWFLLYVLWQAFRDAHRARRYFQRQRPALYLTSFCSYVQHGVAARTALLHGTPVICFGNLQQLGKQLRPDDPYQTKNPVHYRENFLRRPDRDTVIAQARKQLESRLGGGIDPATAYMVTSAYADDGTQPDPEVEGAVVVFLHDFFDSPHIYADLVFPDFWTWACCTIDTLLATGRPFAVKVHPNQVAESVSVIEQLKARYPTVRFIAPTIPNTRLAAAGMKAAITVYGTVVHELAYLGVPSIACARHPHVAFDFCTTARNRSEYVALLNQAHDLSFADPEAMRQQVLEFYAMHNLEGDAEDWATHAALTSYWRTCLDARSDANALAKNLHTLTERPGFVRFVDRLESLVLHGPDNTEART